MRRTQIELSVEELEAILDKLGRPDEDTIELAHVRQKINIAMEYLNNK